MRKSPKPEFGLLSEYRVVFSGISVAAPFAAELYAEQGADVIWIENPHVLDSGRVSKKAELAAGSTQYAQSGHGLSQWRGPRGLLNAVVLL